MRLSFFFTIFFLFNLIVFSLSLKKSVLGQIDDFEQPISDSISYNYEFLIFIFLLLIIGAIIWKLTHRTKERRYFSSEVKRRILKDQNYKCTICKKNTGVWDYDHKNGDKSNNKMSNCQALCPNCHAKKTRGLLKTKEESNSRSLKLFIIFMIIVFLVFIYLSYG